MKQNELEMEKLEGQMMDIKCKQRRMKKNKKHRYLKSITQGNSSEI